MAPPRDHKFSLSRTYWLVWAVLFQAAVHVDCPRGFTASFYSIGYIRMPRAYTSDYQQMNVGSYRSRWTYTAYSSFKTEFMANMWAMFAVVFLAIYTANLAAFMITREEFHDFSGINDTRLQYPSTVSPPFKFGTVPETNSASVLKKHHQRMWSYMQRKDHLRKSVEDGIQSIKKNELDAFIYDATVLDYLVGQDDDCQILTVGSWYAMSGYGLAFPRGSKYLNQFNRKLMEYKERGDIERLQRFWLTGTCKPKKQQRRASEPLAIEQFLSAYLLLAIGIGLAIVLLILEHVYFKYFRKHLAKTDSGGCCALVSLSMGKSLTFRGAVYEAQDQLRRHRCRDPICDTHLWRVRQELCNAKLRLQELEKEIESKDERRASYTRTKSSASLGDLPLSSPGLQPALRRHDLTRNHVSFSRSSAFNPHVQMHPPPPPPVVNKPTPRYRAFPAPLERRHSYENRSPDSPLEGLLRPTANEVTEIETVL